MYLKSQTELNHENPIQSQPHGSEPLSPQDKREKSRKNRKEEKKTLHPIGKKKKKQNPMPIPRNPTALPQL